MRLEFDPTSMKSYQEFVRLKSIPKYEWKGMIAEVPEEYAFMFDRLSIEKDTVPYSPSDFLFDYQAAIAKIAIRKKRFSVFAQPGLGKTAIMLEVARHAMRCLPKHKSVMIVSPLMVVDQTIEESIRFYGESERTPVYVPANRLQSWMNDHGGNRIGITNYEGITEELRVGNVGSINCDESSTFKNGSGAWANRIIKLGKGIEWKTCYTGTPAPNDQIEYANHAVFMDHKRTINEFLASYFINRGQTSERWELKKHALDRFYADLSHWCIFLSDPAVYGWKDNCGTLPPIHVHIDRVDLTAEQNALAQKLTGNLFTSNIGGIGMRGKLSQISKGKGGIATNKTAFIQDLVNSWPNESTIIWVKYNEEQAAMQKAFPDAMSIDGDTPHETRMKFIADFKSRKRKKLISKAKILGLGLNLQVATRHVFSGLSDSYEEWVQCLKRSNRIGSTEDLHAHVPVTELEEPMLANVLRKANRVNEEMRDQELRFKASGIFSNLT